MYLKHNYYDQDKNETDSLSRDDLTDSHKFTDVCKEKSLTGYPDQIILFG